MVNESHCQAIIKNQILQHRQEPNLLLPLSFCTVKNTSEKFKQQVRTETFRFPLNTAFNSRPQTSQKQFHRLCQQLPEITGYPQDVFVTCFLSLQHFIWLYTLRALPHHCSLSFKPSLCQTFHPRLWPYVSPGCFFHGVR